MTELAVVLLVLGVLAGVAAPRILGGSEEAAIEATMLHLKAIAVAVEAYQNDVGDWPPDGLPGDPPPGLDEYLRPNLLSWSCPLGGVYDFDHRHEPSIPHCGVGVELAPERWGLMPEFDARFDDGAPESGWVRFEPAAGRLTLVIED